MLKFRKNLSCAQSGERPNFGLFLDSSPDRWGRVLMQRREAALAREAKRPVRRLVETDYLLGVYDGQRSGALRFRDRESGEAWLGDEASMRTPAVDIFAGTRAR